MSRPADSAGGQAMFPRHDGPWRREMTELAEFGTPIPEGVDLGMVLTQETGPKGAVVPVGCFWLEPSGPDAVRLVTWLLPGAHVDTEMLERQERYWAVAAGPRMLIDRVEIVRTGRVIDNQSVNDKLRRLYASQAAAKS